MLEFKNIEVYDLKQSIIACRNSMRMDLPEYTEEEFQKGLKRAKKLANNGGGSGESNFRTGIRVSFDMKYTQYITKQFQRYHWFDYINSQSMMHRLTAMNIEECCAKYVSQDAIDALQSAIRIYNDIVLSRISEYKFTLRSGEVIEAKTYNDCVYYAYMFCIQNCPMGFELWVRVSTNYEQLSTIARQRHNHKLEEDYGAYMNMIESLPYSYLIYDKRNNTEEKESV